MAASSSADINAMTWAVKRISFMDRENVPILLQNSNGPCPLLAIANILSLRNMLNLPPRSRESVDLRTLTSLVADQLLSMPSSVNSAHEQDLRANVDACLSVLGHLSSGLDVNPRFNDCEGFEATQELTVFDLLGINIMHGWLVDPVDQKTAGAFGNKTYNEVVELMVASGIYDEGDLGVPPMRMSSKGTPLREKPLAGTESFQAPDRAVTLFLKIDEAEGKVSVMLSSKDGDAGPGAREEEKEHRLKVRAQAMVIRDFLESNCTQLTPYGLASLAERMRENQLAVFFRNLHFAVIFKHEGRLFLLVTDQGYLSEPNVVWELISKVDGATDLCNSAFIPYTAPSQTVDSQEASEAYLAALANQNISEEDAAAIALAATEGFGADDDDIPPLISIDDSTQAPHPPPPPPPPPPGSPTDLNTALLYPHTPQNHPMTIAPIGADVGMAAVAAVVDEDADLALAMQLQEEEEFRAQEEAARRRDRERERVEAKQAQVPPSAPSTAQPAVAPRRVGGSAASIQHEDERQKLNKQLADQRLVYAQAHAQARASQAAAAGGTSAGGRGQSAPSGRPAAGQGQGQGQGRGAQAPPPAQQESNCTIS